MPSPMPRHDQPSSEDGSRNGRCLFGPQFLGSVSSS